MNPVTDAMIIRVFILLFLAGALIAWCIWGYFSSNVEQAAYSVVRTAPGYEIREYAPHIVAQTTVSGPYEEALRAGFRIVAGYIFGGNIKKERIVMTAPVTSQKPTAETIAMTAPVTARTEGNTHIISFVMPQSYTLETLPTPADPRVTLVQVPKKKIAALRFSWLRNADRIKKMETSLLAALSRDSVVNIGSPYYAGYNAPWTPPWMVRNEILVEIQ